MINWDDPEIEMIDAAVYQFASRISDEDLNLLISLHQAIRVDTTRLSDEIDVLLEQLKKEYQIDPSDYVEQLLVESINQRIADQIER